MAGHDWVTEHALYFDMMGVAWGYTYANIHREITLRSVYFTLGIIQSNILIIENQAIETDSQKIQVLGLSDMNSTIIDSRN